MSCSTIKSFTYNACEPNLGGIKRVWLANYSDKITYTYEGEDEKPENRKAVASFDESIVWYEYKMRKNVASMTSTLNTSADGAVYVTTELALVFSKMDTEKRLAITALTLGEAIAVVEDANGKKWFLGADAPLTATAGTGETGTQKGDRNAYAITLTDESATFPCALANDIELKENI